jgi:hypothetical protein
VVGIVRSRTQATGVNVNEMIELVSSLPAPQFGDESSRVRRSELVQDFNCSVRCFRLSPGYAYPRTKTTELEFRR